MMHGQKNIKLYLYTYITYVHIYILYIIKVYVEA